MNMKPRIRDYIFAVLWALLTLVIGLLGLPTLLVPRWALWTGWVWSNCSLWLLRKVCGIHSYVRGYSNMPQGPAIYASKHQSAWDTLMLYSLLRNPTFVLKRSLYLVPIFGWYLKCAGHIGIDRKAGKRALDQIVTQAKYHASRGRPIVIFPEGTRRAPYAEPVYKYGVARVSEATQMNVVPVALNAGRVWPRTAFAKRAGSATIEFLPAMPPAGEAREPWLKDLENRIEAAVSKLLLEA